MEVGKWIMLKKVDRDSGNVNGSGNDEGDGDGVCFDNDGVKSKIHVP